MVKISQRIIPILVDCAWGRKNTDISSKYGVRGYPTVIFADPRGEVISKLRDRSPTGVSKQIEEIAVKYRGRDVVPSGPSDLAWTKEYRSAVKTAKKEGKLLLVLLTDEKKSAMATEHALASKVLAPLTDKFVLHRHVVERRCETCKKHRVTQGINIHLIDTTAADPYAKPFERISGKRSAKSLKSKLERALKRWRTEREEI